MPGADELLESMRKAGQEFARMAESIETRLPAIMSELAAAAPKLKPLTDGLDTVKSKIDQISKAAGKVTFSSLVSELVEVNAGMAALFRSADTVSKKLGKITLRRIQDDIQGITGQFKDMSKQAAQSSQDAVRQISNMNRNLGDNLEQRARQQHKLNNELKNMGDRGGGAAPGGATLIDRNSAAVLEQGQKELAAFGREIVKVNEDMEHLANTAGALGPQIAKARDNADELSKGRGLEEWRRATSDVLNQLQTANEDIRKQFGVDVGMPDFVGGLQAKLKKLGNQSGPEAFEASGREMEKFKADWHASR